MTTPGTFLGVGGACLTIDGLPYILATAGCSASVTSTDTNWPGNTPAVLQGALEWPSVKWTEESKLLRGDMEMSSVSFTIHDLSVSTGPAAGFRIGTWLFTRAQSRYVGTQLFQGSYLGSTYPGIAANDTVLVVPSGMASIFSGQVYCEQETMHIVSTTPGGLYDTITVSRAYFGSRRVPHLISSTYIPYLYTAPPTPEAARCTLWLVDVSGVAHCLRVGYVGRPRFVRPPGGTEGGAYQLQSESAWDVTKKATPGIASAQNIQLAGWDMSAIVLYGLSSDGSFPSSPRPAFASRPAHGGGSAGTVGTSGWTSIHLAPPASPRSMFTGSPADGSGDLNFGSDRRWTVTVIVSGLNTPRSVTWDLTALAATVHLATDGAGAVKTSEIASSVAATANASLRPFGLTCETNQVPPGGPSGAGLCAAAGPFQLLPNVAPVELTQADIATYLVGVLQGYPDGTPAVPGSIPLADNPSCQITPSTTSLFIRLSANVGRTMGLMVGFGRDTPATAQSTEGSDPRTLSLVVPLPPCLAWFPNGTGQQTLTVTVGAGSFPTAWTTVNFTDGTETTTVQDALIGQAGQGVNLTCVPTATATVDTNSGAMTITGVWALTSDSGESLYTGNFLDIGGRATGSTYVIIDSQVGLQLCAHVSGSNWVYALKHGLFEDGYTGSPPYQGSVVQAGVDPRNLDWTNVSAVATQAGAHGDARRDYWFDGSQTCGDILAAECVLSAEGVGTRNGRIALYALSPPLPAHPVVASFTDDNFPVIGTVQWLHLEQQIVNQVEVQAPDLSLTIRDAQSWGSFGPQQSVKVKTPNSNISTLSFRDPAHLANQILSTMLYLYRKPLYIVRVPLSGAWLFDIWHGDYVQVTTRYAPDGFGNRGVPITFKGQVINRGVNLTGSGGPQFTIDVLLWDFPYIAGFAPACLIANETSGRTVLGIKTGYIPADITDFAGSNLAGYPFTPNDGGAGFFQPGDNVQIRVVGETYHLSELNQVAAVTPATPSITLTSALSPTMAAIIDGGHSLVVITLAPYSDSPTTNEKQYGFVAAQPSEQLSGGVHGYDWSP